MGCRVSFIPMINNKRVYLTSKKSCKDFVDMINSKPYMYDFELTFKFDNGNDYYKLYCNKNKLSGGIIYDYDYKNPLLNVCLVIDDNKLIDFIYKYRREFNMVMTEKWYGRSR